MESLGNYFDVNKVTSMVNKVRNAVLNVPEYEAKVRDATNNDPWGASSTLMMDIANATANFNHFNDIMNTIYKRCQEPPSSTWRQTYKALQLLEYLIKNGSERVIDSARSHVYELRVLQSYQYVDEKKKDQGLNVRNRAKEITELLASDDKIRTERTKAKENRAKYVGVSAEQMLSGSAGFAGGSGGGGGEGFGGSGKKYGGFGPGSSTSSSSGPSFREGVITQADVATGRAASRPSSSSISAGAGLPKPVSQQPQTQQRKQPVAGNLLDLGGGDDWSDFSSAPSSNVPGSGTGGGRLDDFADFQSAPLSNSAARPPVTAAGNNANGGFASFGQPSQPVAQASFASFANFGSAPSPAAAPAPASFAAFPPPSSTAAAAALPFGTAPLAPQPMSPFGNFESSAVMTPVKPASVVSDPMSKLVSLDAMALTPGVKREEQTGPSLNSMGASRPALNPAMMGGPASGMGMGMGFGAPLVPMQAPSFQQQAQHQNHTQHQHQQQTLF